MVKPGGTGRPRFAISARPAPLPPSRSRMPARPSALPLPKLSTHFAFVCLAAALRGRALVAAALAEARTSAGFLGGAADLLGEAFATAVLRKGAGRAGGFFETGRRGVSLAMSSRIGFTHSIEVAA